ncbi:cyclic nucleotide-binding protein [Actinoplanes awajinensis]|uniref:Cyclic nucleotide-binding protein n=1 Tax=Actinoplanes awajinensis subsp. mycoplanecinus TaxID=135947 RepID=A0A101JMM1_9ACTN|nr:cyclic nucleotide-binding protein [Actinoplanes awajinensis]KUL29522.1 cyclic nucleotide-binding protein [Actinoplanes awajinensis subsp. mycoplanecinus]
MTYVETRTSVWEALAGRAPGAESGPADAGLWHAVADRLNPSRARPELRGGIEVRHRTTVRGGRYVMLRSPDDGGRSCYLRLTPEEYQLALMMDGVSTVARLVAEFARIAGRLAPDQVRRVVADLAGNRMLEDLPGDAFRPLREMSREPLPKRVGGSLLGALRGRRMISVHADGALTGLYNSVGKLLFTRPAVWLGTLLAMAGAVLFVMTWQRGGHALFLAGDSYLLGALALLLLNVIALGLHELGHALAAKRVGREVPVAGLMLHFGLPTVFVDTTDVWMAGRRARIAVTAAGPATGLALAGLVQLVGLAAPATSGIAFKLAFLFYLHSFFNLSPLLPLDGQYLLMDWLEIPDLRARGLAWLGGRLRRRGPRWSVLDREGRLIALYGLLALFWLAAAVALGYRLWTDRVHGLVTGLWYEGAASRVLLVLMLLGLTAPPLYFLLGRIGRGWRRWRQRAAERDQENDMPRRMAALYASDLGGLPDPALQSLAARARWSHPSVGRQLVLAGEHQPVVYVVVEGALHGRRPGDPGGTIRHHAGPGTVVGLAAALTGRSAALDWHAAGSAVLLAVPTSTVTTVVGPLPGPPPMERAEAEALFADTPALAGLEEDQQLALIAAAHPVDLEPGAPVILHGPTHAVVVESGVIAMPDGVELRRGTLVGPVGDGTPGMVAQTRTPVRLWIIPDASDLPPLIGFEARPGAPMPGVRPGAPLAVRPGAVHPPLAVPPGPPPESDEEFDVDRHFEKRMWVFVSLLLVVVFGGLVLDLGAGPAWAEMPTERALLTVDRGQATTQDGGDRQTVPAGQRRYLSAGAQVEAPGKSRARLTFPGGGAVLLCPGARITLNAAAVTSGRQAAPSGRLTLESGRLLADTAGTSGAYQPLRLTIARAQGDVSNTGASWYSVDPSAVAVANGTITAGGVESPATGGDLTCGDGVKIPQPATTEGDDPSEAPFPSDEPVAPSASAVPSLSVSPSASVSASASPSASASTSPTPSRTPNGGATTVPETPTTRPTSRSASPKPTATTNSPSPSPSPSSAAPSPSVSTTPVTEESDPG